MNLSKILTNGSKFILFSLPFLFLVVFYFQPLIANFRIIGVAPLSDPFRSISLAAIARPLIFTFWQAILSTFLTIVVGFPAAYIFARYKFWGKSIFRLLTTLPFIMPTIVVAAGFNALLGANGWLNLFLQNFFSLDQPPIRIINTLGAILLAHVFYNSTVFIRVVGGALEQLDPKYEFAARTLGASTTKVWQQVILPLLKPAIFSAMLLVFIFNFTSFAVILLLGGPSYATLEVEIYIQAMHLLNLPLAGILSVIQLICTLLFTIIYTKIVRKKNVSLTPRNPEDIQKPVRNWVERVLITSNLIFLVLLFVLPLLSLAIRSFLIMEPASANQISNNSIFTLTYYQELFVNRRGSLFYVPPIDAILNSLYFGLITVGIVLFLGFLAAKMISTQDRWGRILDPILMMPLGTSAVTIGLGYILVFNKPPLDVRSFPLLVPIVHSLVALPFVVRILLPVIKSIPKELKYSAQILGASPWQSWWQIEFPIIFKASISAALFAFTISLGEFGATTFISRPEMPTIPVAIYRYLSQPGGLNYGQAMAMSTILMVICAISIFLIERLELPKLKEF
ncbi:MAG TPA: iron ABC transporter permease [Anaerolineaceae bacterium]|nr:iron ABC transporter permease [Anaerolineaceae bacterium]